MNDPTLLAIQLAIAAEPENETPRRAYLDRLRELADEAGWVKCPKCMGTGSHALNPYELAQRYGTHNAGKILDAAKCGICSGTGEVRDTTYADRLRHVEIMEWQHENPIGYNDCGEAREANDLRTRYEAEWRRAGDCPQCNGTMNEDAQQIADDPLPCRVCHGTGAACWPLEQYTEWDGAGTPLITCTWSRGFISGITTTCQNFLRPGVAGTIARWWALERVTLSDKQVNRSYLYDASEMDELPQEENIPTVLFNAAWDIAPEPTKRTEVRAVGVGYYRRIYFAADDGNTLAKQLLSAACVHFARSEAARLFPLATTSNPG